MADGEIRFRFAADNDVIPGHISPMSPLLWITAVVLTTIGRILARPGGRSLGLMKTRRFEQTEQ